MVPLLLIQVEPYCQSLVKEWSLTILTHGMLLTKCSVSLTADRNVGCNGLSGFNTWYGTIRLLIILGSGQSGFDWNQNGNTDKNCHTYIPKPIIVKKELEKET